MEIFILMAVLWCAFGWWFACHIWRRAFDLTVAGAIFITLFCWMGPGMGLTWMLVQWLNNQPHKEPRVILPRRND